jgi:hypothetical protein
VYSPYNKVKKKCLSFFLRVSLSLSLSLSLSTNKLSGQLFSNNSIALPSVNVYWSVKVLHTHVGVSRNIKIVVNVFAWKKFRKYCIRRMLVGKITEQIRVLGNAVHTPSRQHTSVNTSQHQQLSFKYNTQKENPITLYSKPENDLYRYKYVVLKITYFYNYIYM